MILSMVSCGSESMTSRWSLRIGGKRLDKASPSLANLRRKTATGVPVNITGGFSGCGWVKKGSLAWGTPRLSEGL